VSIWYSQHMKEWIPIPGSKKERLIQEALEAFKHNGYAEVNISELAKKANMTTGAIYHHFGSKASLYSFIRAEMEQRIIDRMEGAAAIFQNHSEKLQSAMLIGLAFAVKMNLCHLLHEEVPEYKENKVERFFEEVNNGEVPGLEHVLSAIWKSVLKGIAEEKLTMEQGEALIKWVFKKELSN